MIEVVRIQPTDGPVLRETRLAALLDTPSAFARTHAHEAGLAMTHWDEAARARSSGRHQATFLGREPHPTGPAAGMVGGYREPGDSTMVNLVAMWVRPDHRRQGLGRRLVGAIVEWAETGGGVDRIELWVTNSNDGARRFYARCGFTDDGRQQPLPSDPSVLETRMRLAL